MDIGREQCFFLNERQDSAAKHNTTVHIKITYVVDLPKKKKKGNNLDTDVKISKTLI